MKFNIEAAKKGAKILLRINAKTVESSVVYSTDKQVVVKATVDGVEILVVIREDGYYCLGEWRTAQIAPVVRYLNLYSDNSCKVYESEECAIAASKLKTKIGYPIVVAQRIESEF